jgi:hypothetical protein
VYEQAIEAQPHKNKEPSAVLQSIGLIVDDTLIFKDGMLLAHASSEYKPKQVNPLHFQWTQGVTDAPQIAHLALN